MWDKQTMPLRKRGNCFHQIGCQGVGFRGIRANAVAPGFIKSQMTDVLPDKVKAELEKQIPLSRLGLPEDVAKAVVF